MQFLKMYPSENVLFRDYNRKIIELYFNNRLIYENQAKALVANANKIFESFKHPAYIFKLEDGNIYAIFRTSQEKGFVRRPLTLEEIETATEASFHNADRVEIEEFLGRYYVPRVYKLGPEKNITIYTFRDVNSDTLLPEDLHKFQEYYKNNIRSFKEADISWYIYPYPFLDALVKINKLNKNE